MKLLKFSGLLLLPTIFSLLAHSAYAKEPVITKTNTGFKFGSSQNINTATITDWNFKGECPGSKEQRKFTSVRFISESTPPASGLRVLVRNISKGFEGDPVPFSDREYSEQGGSEDLKLEFSKRHNGKYLALSLEGEVLKNQPVSNKPFVPLPFRPVGSNGSRSLPLGSRLISSSEISNSFEYEIKRGSEVIETGKFTVLFEKLLREGTSYRTFIPKRVSESFNQPVCVKRSFTIPGACERYFTPAAGTVKPGYEVQCVYTRW